MTGRWVALIVAVLLAVAASTQARAQRTDDLDALSKQVGTLYADGKYARATEVAERWLALAERKFGRDHVAVAPSLSYLALLYQSQGRYAEAEPLYKRAEKALGPDHAHVRVLLSNLALLYQSQGRYAEAERLYKRSLALYEKALGANHPDLGVSLTGLALVYQSQGRYAEAEPLVKRSLALYEKALGPDHLQVGTSLNNLADLYQSQGRYAEAEPLYKRGLALTEKALGTDHPQIGFPLNNLALHYQSQGRYAESEPLHKRSLALREKALGPDHPYVGMSLNSLAELYQSQGRYAEAEPLYKRTLTLYEKALGPSHSDVGTSLSNLALLYHIQGRYAEAEPLYRRSLALREKALGPEHPHVGTSLNNLGGLYEMQGRYTEAEPLYKRGLALREKALGPDHSHVGVSLNNLAWLYQRQGRNAEAEPLYKRSLVLSEKALGSDHPDVGTTLSGLALLYQSQGHYAEAEPLFKRSLALYEKALGSDHPYVGNSLNNLAMLAFVQSDWQRAVDYSRRSTSVIVQRAQRGTNEIGRVLIGKGKSESEHVSYQFWGLVKAAHRLASEPRLADARLPREMFQTAQWASASETAQSLAQMAVRAATGDSGLSRLVRERQDLVGEWQAKDKTLVAAHAEPPARRHVQAEAALSTRLAAIGTRIGEIDATFKDKFPNYASLASAAPLSIVEVQAQLLTDEALILFLDTPEQKPVAEETFIWVISKTDMRWVRSQLGTKALSQRVAALRCGLDEEEWATPSKAAACGQHLGLTDLPDSSAPLPFDLGIAHELYQGLFGQIEDLIKDKRLVLVPSGPLSSLPFHVLVTKRPKAARPKSFAGYHNIFWFGRSQALTVLPAVSSLKALRQHASRGAKPSDDYIGYGDPVLKGDGATCRTAKVPDTCPKMTVAAVGTQATAGDGAGRATIRGRGGRRSAGLGDVFARGGGSAAVLEHVRALCPLPDTAYEIRCVARGFRDKATQIRLDRSAKEADIKALNKDGLLARYRVVHFATHGLLAGDVEMMTKRQGEPALVMTPPDDPQDKDDDGLLTASEVTELKLNADWVVMSACNTAASDRLGAEALSGLARAFFYAGARALLVSHWPVYSDAAVRLTTSTFAHLDRDPNVAGRAEALQRAMIDLMDDSSQEDNAHPAVWAPFVVVGEGAR